MKIDKTKASPAMDYDQHEETYARFLRFTKYSIVFLVLLLAGMKFFLV